MQDRTNQTQNFELESVNVENNMKRLAAYGVSLGSVLSETAEKKLQEEEA